MKSSLKRPLKFLIRLLSSSLPNAVIEVDVCSKYSTEAIVPTFTDLSFQVSFAFSTQLVSALAQMHFCKKFCIATNVLRLANYELNFFCHFAAGLIMFGYEDREAAI